MFENDRITTKQEKARRLRRNGKSYAEIRKIIRVSKSTLSLWVRDIELSKKQLQELRGRCKPRYTASKNRQKERIRLTKHILNNAKTEAVRKFKNPLFLSGLMLYWAEGAKGKSEMVHFSNSDPNMISLMMVWFREVCLVPEYKFKIQIHIHNLQNNAETKRYWSDITKIPTNQFHKLMIKKTSLTHRKNPLYNGTCSIRIYDRNLFRKMAGWKIGVLEKFDLKDNYIIPK